MINCERGHSFSHAALSSRPRPRFALSKRLWSLIIVFALLSLCDIIYLNIYSNHSNGYSWSQIVAQASSYRRANKRLSVEARLVDILVRTKACLDTTEFNVEDITAHADKTIIFKELNSLATQVENGTLPGGLNATTLDPYSQTLQRQQDLLFPHLFPFISRHKNTPRSFEQLRARYTGGKGLIIPVGKDQFQYALHLIVTLKRVHRTKLPIVVVYAGNDDLPNEYRTALKSLDPSVSTEDVLNFFDEEIVGLLGGGWAIKIFALLATRFSECLIVDADAVFLQDPMAVFEDPNYLETGTLFFRDREIFPGDGNVHEWWAGVMKGREPSQEMQKSPFWTDRASREEMESGVVVFDKTRSDVVIGLIFVAYLNTRAVRDAVTYQYTYGDKESFWMGFELVKVPYQFRGLYAASIGILEHPTGSHSMQSRMCTDHHLHLSYTGKPLWWNGSLFQEKRLKNRGFFVGESWAVGTVDWDCDHEPWCMRGMRKGDVHHLRDDGLDTVLTSMNVAAVYWESKFRDLIPEHGMGE